MLGVLVQQSSLHKAPDHLGCDPTLAEIGKHPAVIHVGRRESKGELFLLFLGLLRSARRGRVTGAAMLGQQVLHGLRETFVIEPLEECDGISADAL